MYNLPLPHQQTSFRTTVLVVIAMLLAMGCGSQKQVTPFGTTSKKAFVLFGEAMREHDLLRDNEALELLKKAIKLDPRYVDALGLTGEIQLSRKNYTAAAEAFQTILSIDPDHIYALSDLAQIHFELDDYDHCLLLLNKMLPLVGFSDKRNEVLLRIASAEFAKAAISKPVPFKPVNLGPSINTIEEEYFPGLSTDESQLFFTRRDGRLNIYAQNEDIFVSTRSDDKWLQSKNLGSPVNTKENEGAFSTSPDGKFLIFTSCSRPGGVGRCDLWYTENVGNKWMEPVNLGKPVNTVEWESQPSLSADGVTLYFVSNRSDGYGGSDIWYSTKTESGWSKPRNLGPNINTPGDEQFPFIHQDGRTLYFTSGGLPGMGKSDIFYTRLEQGKWSDPVNLGYPINTHGDEWNFIVNRTGDVAYFASDGIEGGYGGMDIYSMELYESARPRITGYVKGVVFDIDTKEKLGADIELYQLASGDKMTTTHSDPKTGTFLLSLPSNDNYAFKAKAEGYLFHSEHFALTSSSLKEPFMLEIGLKKIRQGQTMVMKNAFFDVDKWELKEESRVELNQVAIFLNQNPELKVEIGGHTDNTGNEPHNLVLSKNRAESVYLFLINAGINSGRLSFKGYGSSVPVADNNTEAGRALNRRTELKVL